MSKSQCSTPGYIRDSLLGCYKIVLYPTAVTYDEGRHACVNDGGQLFLVNSAEKGVHLIKAISTCFSFSNQRVFIRISRILEYILLTITMIVG